MEVGTEYQEKGYSAYDNYDGDITDKVVIKYQFQAKGSNNWEEPETMDANKLGTYRINYTVTDSSGNIGKGSRVVEIVDTTKPAVRELRVQNYYNPTGNKNYSGLTQTPGQNKGIAITVNTTEKLAKNPTIIVGGKEFSVPVQNEQFNVYVIYVDLTNDMSLVEGEKIPVTVTGLEDLAGNTGDDVTLTGNGEYYVIFDKTSPGATVKYNTENLTGDSIIANLYTTEPVTIDDTDWKEVEANHYQKVYNDNKNYEITITDKAGNNSTVKITINNIDKVAPTVTLNGDAEMTVSQGAEFKDPGVTVTDNYDKNPSLITVINYSETGKDGTFTTVDSVDTSKLGVYTIHYKATDAQGNVSEAIRRTVKVVDTTVPTAKAEYSTTDMTTKVTVTVTASEPIKFVGEEANSWNPKNEYATVLKKVYYLNVNKTLTFEDASGNTGTIDIVINNIDNKGPKAEVSQSKDNSQENKVWVTLAFDEKIDESSLPQGWTAVPGKENIYHKAYNRAKSDKVTVKDVLGNESTIEFTVEM